MVVDMKEGELSPLFTEDNENSVPEVPHLGNIKQPKKVGHWWIGCAEWFTWHQGVVISVCNKECFQSHVSTKHDL